MTRDFPNTEVGFIGIGKLGFPLAKRLSESGLKVNAYDIQEKYSEKCDGTNITFIKNLKDITKILLSLTIPRVTQGWSRSLLKN